MAEKKEVKKRVINIDKLVVSASKWKESNADFESTGILPLDIGLVRGGYRKGRIIETFGPEHSGKTLMAMLAIIWNQKTKGEKSLFIDAEGSFDINWFRKLGGIDDLLDIYNPYDHDNICGEEVYDNIVEMLGSSRYRLAALDSIMAPALLSKKLLDRDLAKEARMGVQPTLNKEFEQRAAIQTLQTGTILIITNHLMEKLGFVMGNPETTSGGKYLKFLSEQRLKTQAPKDKTVEGHTVRIKIIKNKRGGSAGSEHSFYLDYNTGIDNYEEMGKLFKKKGWIKEKEKDDYIDSIRKDFKEYENGRQRLLNSLELNQLGTAEEVEDDEDFKEN